MPDDTTSPVAAEGLRERLIIAIRDAKCDHGLGQFACAHCRADAVLAEPVGDPGDLPARMAAKLREAIEYELTTGSEKGLAELIASLEDPMSSALVAAALSVRWEDHAQTVAENAELRRKEEHAVKEHQVTRERLAEARRTLHDLAENIKADAIARKSEVAALREANADLDELIKSERKTHEQTIAEVAALREELAEAKRRASTCSCGDTYATYEGPEPDCPVHGAIRALGETQRALAEARAVIERMQADRSFLALSELEACESRLTRAEATIERVRALRGRSSMGRVNDYVPLADVLAALDARPDDPEEIRRLAQATESTEETTTDG